MAPYGAKRLSREDYTSRVAQIMPVLFSLGDFGWIEIPSYSTKQTFGDVDILCKNTPHNIVDLILGAFSSPPYQNNGNVLSFLFKDLQVDVIRCTKETYQSSLDYFSYNDLGNLIGKVCKGRGLSYGHLGLMFEVIVAENVRTKLIVSSDTRKIHEYLGLSHDIWLEGFQDREDMFQFVLSSKYFDRRLFYFENLNSIDRRRDQKRVTYNAFLEYVASLPEVGDGALPPVYNIGETLEKLDVLFPDFKVRREAVLGILLEKKALQNKFNGNRIVEWLATIGKNVDKSDVGPFIRGFRGKVPNFDAWVQETPLDEVIRITIKEYHKYEEENSC